MLPETGVAGMWNQGKYKFSVVCVHLYFIRAHENVFHSRNFTCEILSTEFYVNRDWVFLGGRRSRRHSSFSKNFLGPHM